MQFVAQPTWNDNVLDLIFCSYTQLISCLSCDAPFATSEHNTISFSVKKCGPNTAAARDELFVYDYKYIRLCLSINIKVLVAHTEDILYKYHCYLICYRILKPYLYSPQCINFWQLHMCAQKP